jgi:hypothetical protein
MLREDKKKCEKNLEQFHAILNNEFIPIKWLDFQFEMKIYANIITVCVGNFKLLLIFLVLGGVRRIANDFVILHSQQHRSLIKMHSVYCLPTMKFMNFIFIFAYALYHFRK